MGATETHAFDLGESVAVFNSTLGGRPLFEGYGTIVKILDTEHYYRVRFKRTAARDGGNYDRFVWPGEQQDDPDGWLTKQQAAYDAAKSAAA